MSQIAGTTHQDSIYQQPHLGLAEGTTPVLPQCTIDGCTFIGSSLKSAQDHIAEEEHISCHIASCEGRYSTSQEVVHMWKYHQNSPAVVEEKPIKCQFVDCQWSTDSAAEQSKHENEFHTICDVVDCGFRNTLNLYLIHASVAHEGNEPKMPEPEWTPAEDALLDFLWLKHQSFDATMDIIVEILPHRLVGASPLKGISDHILLHKYRYEHMSMDLKGEGIVQYLKDIGLLDDLAEDDK